MRTAHCAALAALFCLSACSDDAAPAGSHADAEPLAADARDAGAPSTPDSVAPTPPACGMGAFCADFEDQLGATPSGAWSVGAPNCQGDGKVAVDTQTVHGGKRALRVTSGGGYCNHVFATPTLPKDALQGPLWVRWYVRFGTALSDAHVTFFAMHDQVSGKDLRMGGQNKILMWNRETDDATLPELSPTGVGLSVSPTPNAWECLEFQLDPQTGSMTTFRNGQRVEGLVVDKTPTQNVDGQWLRGVKDGVFRAQPTDLRFGWESYGGGAMSLWIDDVVVAHERPGC